MLAEGKYKARAIEWSQVTQHEKTGNEEIRVLFGIEGGDASGQTITWRGYFTEATAERSIESLRYMGWTGDDITDIQGLDANEVQLVIKHEQYEGKTQVKVAWVNRAQSVYVGTPLDASKKQAFAQRMKGLVLATKGTAGSNPTRQAAGSGDSFPYGHNQPPSSQQPPARAGGVKL